MKQEEDGARLRSFLEDEKLRVGGYEETNLNFFSSFLFPERHTNLRWSLHPNAWMSAHSTNCGAWISGGSQIETFSPRHFHLGTKSVSSSCRNFWKNSMHLFKWPTERWRRNSFFFKSTWMWLCLARFVPCTSSSRSLEIFIILFKSKIFSFGFTELEKRPFGFRSGDGWCRGPSAVRAVCGRRD